MAWLRVAALAVSVDRLCDAANWAQVSGDNMQNTADSRPPPWSRRWGHAGVVLPGGGMLGASEKLLILGGDSFHMPTTTNDEIIASAEVNTSPQDPSWPPAGGGQLKNDVWATTGAAWQTYDDYLHRNAYGDPTSRVASATTWVEMVRQHPVPCPVSSSTSYTASVQGYAAEPPYGVPYYEWLCCIANASMPCMSTVCNGTVASVSVVPLTSAGRTGYTNVTGIATGQNISNAGMLPGPRRWSPRRSHAAVVVPQSSGSSVIVVMGGRARSENGYSPAPGAASAGMQDKGHEDAMLMNDVWTSADGGATWSIANGGCTVPHILQSSVPPLHSQACVADADCMMYGNARCTSSACTCQHWTPRERFAAAVLGSSIYVAGGVVWQPQGQCGQWTCPSRGAAVALNDVWTSVDLGSTWQLVTAAAAWAPRADAAMIVSGSALLLLTGRTYTPGAPSSTDLLSDVWTSTAVISSSGVLGDTWQQVQLPAAWSPRAAPAVAVATSVLALMGGQVVVPTATPTAVPDPATLVDLAVLGMNAPMKQPTATPSPSTARGNDILGMHVGPSSDVWTLQLNASLNGTNAAGPGAAYMWNASIYTLPLVPSLDFTSNRSARTSGYVHGRMPLQQLQDIPAATLSLLATRGITTVGALSAVSAAMVQMLKRDGVHDICAYKRWAGAIVARCSVRRRGFEGDISGVVFRNVDTKVRAPPPVDDGCLGDTSIVIGKGLLEAGNAPCRQVWPPRAFMPALVVNGTLYVAGGMSELNYAYNDLWYRDEVAPITRITRQPRDGTSDTRFTFAANEPGCKFEYRAVDVGTGYELRAWSPVAANYDASRINDDRRRTRLEVRAVDPAGNRDDAIELGRNAVEWTYVPPFPWLILTLILIFSFLVVLIALLLYRRYRLRKMYEEFIKRRRLLKLGARMKRRFAEYDGTLKSGVDVNDRQRVDDDQPIRAPDVDGPRFNLDMAPEVEDEEDVDVPAVQADATDAPPPPTQRRGRRSAKVAPAPLQLQPGLPAPVSLVTGQVLSPAEALSAVQRAPSSSVLGTTFASRSDIASPTTPGRRSARVAPLPLEASATPRAGGGMQAQTATPSAVLLADNRLVDPATLRLQAESLPRRTRVTALSALRTALQQASATVSPGAAAIPASAIPSRGRASARIAPAMEDSESPASTRRQLTAWIPSGPSQFNASSFSIDARAGRAAGARVAPSPAGTAARVITVMPRLGSRAPSPDRDPARGRSAGPRTPLLQVADQRSETASPARTPARRSSSTAAQPIIPWR